MGFKSLADFKRKMILGARVKRRWGNQEPLTGCVTTSQSNAVAFTYDHNPVVESWLYYPKAKECRFEDGAMIIINEDGSCLLSYEEL